MCLHCACVVPVRLFLRALEEHYSLGSRLRAIIAPAHGNYTTCESSTAETKTSKQIRLA
jgi:hypothetical protein